MGLLETLLTRFGWVRRATYGLTFDPGGRLISAQGHVLAHPDELALARTRRCRRCPEESPPHPGE
ncbi:MAG: hypothetical protein R2939_19585 [Kofleriaceae bacterium]